MLGMVSYKILSGMTVVCATGTSGPSRHPDKHISSSLLLWTICSILTSYKTIPNICEYIHGVVEARSAPIPHRMRIGPTAPPDTLSGQKAHPQLRFSAGMLWI